MRILYVLFGFLLPRAVLIAYLLSNGLTSTLLAPLLVVLGTIFLPITVLFTIVNPPLTVFEHVVIVVVALAEYMVLQGVLSNKRR